MKSLVRHGGLAMFVGTLLTLSGAVYSQDRPTQQKGKKDVKKTKGKDIKELNDADLAAAVKAALQAIDQNPTDEEVAEHVKGIRKNKERAFTFSLIGSAITLDRQRKIIMRIDIHGINTVIGEDADPRDVDHENSHRTINMILLDDGFLAAFFLLLVDNSTLDQNDINKLAHDKLCALDGEINEFYDTLEATASDKELLAIPIQEKEGKTLAELKTTVLNEILKRKIAAATNNGKNKLTKKEDVKALLDAADETLKEFQKKIKNFDKLNELYDDLKKKGVEKFVDEQKLK